MYLRLAKLLQSHSFFLFGARGTGKTMLLRQNFADKKDILWIDLLREGQTLSYSRNPSQLRSLIDAMPTKPEFVVIDEVQRVSSLLNEVHALIEERQIKFALIGSSARKLKRGAANLLAGRAIRINLFPLTTQELGNDFDLNLILNWGSLPGALVITDEALRASFLRSYVDLYLREEIREEQIVRNLDPFARFLEVAAQSNGNIINYSRIGREAGTDSKGVARYFQILEETLIGFFLEPYHASIRKRQRQQAKFYLFDIGVKRALESALGMQISPRTYEWGRAFEHLVILEAHRMNSYLQADYQFSYLRTNNDAEVDLIAEKKGSPTWAIEIKSSDEIDPVDIRKLKQLAKDLPNCTPAFFCNAKEARKIEGVYVLPWREGLQRLFTFKKHV
jgi:predicted AAA+ superfamily ATPase